MNISIFNNAGQVDYLLGLVSGLSLVKEDTIDVLDADEQEKLFSPFENVRFHPVFYSKSRGSSIVFKAWNILRLYLLQIAHLIFNSPRIIHFQWLDRNKIPDRIVLPLLARLRGHKIVYTVHNVNAEKRDNRDTWTNRLTLKTVYKLSHHLIVHTHASKVDLINEFRLSPQKISVVKHGINNRVIQKGLSQSDARKSLSIGLNEKVVLFFGNIDFYKGLDILIESLEFLPPSFYSSFRILIAGKPKSEEYKTKILDLIEKSPLKEKIMHRIAYVNSNDIETYFMAADCIVLPYRQIYQSGVIFMAYTFGLPVLASNIGNFSQDVPEGKSGYLLNENNPKNWSELLIKYFESPLYKNLPETRNSIKQWANDFYSWEKIGAQTREIYSS